MEEFEFQVYFLQNIFIRTSTTSNRTQKTKRNYEQKFEIKNLEFKFSF